MPLQHSLAIHLAMLPNAGTKDPIERREAHSEAKLKAEGTPAEIQTVLGWVSSHLLTTRRQVCCLVQRDI